MDNAVLIADGDRARAERIGEACAARGFATSLARNGAEALEAAITDVPEVVVAPLDLALIDGERLADILRANPRTQNVRFLFVGPVPPDANPDVQEALALGSPDEVAMQVEAILAQRARSHLAERDAEEDHEVQGRLSQIPLTDLLQLFHMNRRTGTLQLSRREGGGREERASLWIRDGNLIQATVGRVEGEKALFRVLAWKDGSFAFTPNRVTATARIGTPTRALLLEGMRQLDEWDRIRGSLPSLDTRVTLTVDKGSLPGGVHPLTQEVLLLLEIHDVVRDVVDHCSYSDYQVLRTIHTLAERGIVELRREPDGVRAKGAELFAPGQVRRLRAWMQSMRPRAASLHDARLLVVSPDEATTRDVMQQLGRLPEMTLASAFTRDDFTASDVVRIGRLAVDDELGIELLHVPADPAFAAVWPLAGHRALGTLLLLPASGVAEAEAALEAVNGELRRQREARVFHVVVSRKGERMDPAEVATRLPLLERSSVFLLQLERATESESLLQTMLGRILP